MRIDSLQLPADLFPLQLPIAPRAATRLRIDFDREIHYLHDVVR